MDRGKWDIFHRQALSPPVVFRYPQALRKIGSALVWQPMCVGIGWRAVITVVISVAAIRSVAAPTWMSGGTGIGSVSMPS